MWEWVPSTAAAVAVNEAPVYQVCVCPRCVVMFSSHPIVRSVIELGKEVLPSHSAVAPNSPNLGLDPVKRPGKRPQAWAKAEPRPWATN